MAPRCTSTQSLVGRGPKRRGDSLLRETHAAQKGHAIASGASNHDNERMDGHIKIRRATSNDWPSFLNWKHCRICCRRTTSTVRLCLWFQGVTIKFGVVLLVPTLAQAH